MKLRQFTCYFFYANIHTESMNKDKMFKVGKTGFDGISAPMLL